MKLSEIKQKLTTANETPLSGVTREYVNENVPLLVEALDTIRRMRLLIRDIVALAEDVSDKTADYALNHTASVFGDTYGKSAKGVESGDTTIDGTAYHLASGYSSPKRLDLEPITQAFLSELPKTWVKAEMRLDTTGINREGATAEDLEKKGLYRPIKNTWSVSDGASALE